MAAPSARDDELCLLIDHHPVGWRYVLEVDGPLPVHVDVGGAVVASIDAIRAIDIDAYHVVVEIVGIGDDRDNGQVVVVVAIDVTPRDDGAWEQVVHEESEAIDGGAADVEDAVRTCRAVGEGGRRAVGGVAQGGSLRDVDVYGEGVGEESGVGIYLRCFQAELGEGAAVVRCGQGRFSCPAPLVAAVLDACPGATCDALGIAGRGQEGALGIEEIEGAAAIRQLEAYLPVGIVAVGTVRYVVVEEDGLVASCLDDTVGVSQHELPWL